MQGAVRVMHPDKGMGVEFTQATPEHCAAVEKFLGVLTSNRSLLPELLVEPEGLQSDSRSGKPSGGDSDDPLLQLFSADSLTAEEFHGALRKQRGAPSVSAAHA